MSLTMPFHKTYPSLFTVLAGLVGMAFLVQPSPSINRVLSDIRELENLGSVCPKVLKAGAIEDTYDRDRPNREKRQKT